MSRTDKSSAASPTNRGPRAACGDSRNRPDGPARAPRSALKGGGPDRVVQLLAGASLMLAAACGSPLSARIDARPSADARIGDASPDVVPAPDLPGPDAVLTDLALPGDLAQEVPAKDSAGSDLAPTGGLPKAFRIDNHTDHTAYIDSSSPIGCRRQSAAGWQECSYFTLGCIPRCDGIPQGAACCAYCEGTFVLQAIPPGASLSLPWNGLLHSKVTGHCAQDCPCQQAAPAESGVLEVSARIYASYTCMASGCATTSDGKLEMAVPAGDSVSVTVWWSLPYLGDEVVLDIIWLPPGADAATAADAPSREAIPADAGRAPDSSSADGTIPRDASSEPPRLTLGDLAGRTYRIAANDTPADAGFGGRACGSSNLGAIYDIEFSADAKKASIVRMDGPEEIILVASLWEASSTSSLVYRIDNAFAGGELSIRAEGSTLIALLVLYGSGVPVIWCIDSPMIPR
jgi:hypothetical protein